MGRSITKAPKVDDTGVGIDRPPKGPSAEIVRDLIEDAVVEDGPYGPRITRGFLVDGLSGTPTGILIQALRVRGIPYLGQYHPDYPVPVDTVTAHSVPGSPTKAKVVAVYNFPYTTGGLFDNEPSETDLPQVEIITGVRTVKTDLDRNGNPIVGTYLDPESSEPRQKLEWIEYQEPVLTFRYHRRERGSPGLKSRQYTGCVNGNMIFGDPVRTWLCTGISGVSDDGGRSYKVSYEFQYNRNGWLGRVIALDDEGHVQPGAEPQTYMLYPEADFWPLNLTT